MSKPVTIGEHIESLVKTYGETTTHIYVLERALVAACHMPPASIVTINGVLVGETPGYRKLQDKKIMDMELRVRRKETQ